MLMNEEMNNDAQGKSKEERLASVSIWTLTEDTFLSK